MHHTSQRNTFIELGVGIQVGIAKMYFTHYMNMLNSKFSFLFVVIQFIIIGCGLGQSQPSQAGAGHFGLAQDFATPRPLKAKLKAPTCMKHLMYLEYILLLAGM